MHFPPEIFAILGDLKLWMKTVVLRSTLDRDFSGVCLYLFYYFLTVAALANADADIIVAKTNIWNISFSYHFIFLIDISKIISSCSIVIFLTHQILASIDFRIFCIKKNNTNKFQINTFVIKSSLGLFHIDLM